MARLVRLLKGEVLVRLTRALAETDSVVIDWLLALGRGRSPDRTIVTTCWIGLISRGVRVPAAGR